MLLPWDREITGHTYAPALSEKIPTRRHSKQKKIPDKIPKGEFGTSYLMIVQFVC